MLSPRLVRQLNNIKRVIPMLTNTSYFNYVQAKLELCTCSNEEHIKEFRYGIVFRKLILKSPSNSTRKLRQNFIQHVIFYIKFEPKIYSKDLTMTQTDAQITKTTSIL